MTTETLSEDREAVSEKIPVRNWWHMLLYAWDLVEFKDRFDTEIENAPDLRALLTKILVFLMKHQVRRGLRGDYVERSEELRGVRGRIDFGETLRGMSMYRGRLHCEFEEFTLNVPRNQIIRSTLNDSLNRGFTEVEEDRPKYGNLVSDVEALLRMLYEIDRVRVTRRLISSELRLLGRNEREYKLMLKICEMLQDPSMPQSDTASDLEVVDWLRRKEDENKIFELFVANFYKFHLDNSEWKVDYHKQLSWKANVQETTGDLKIPGMETDIWLTHLPSNRYTILDTKFYQSPFDQRHDARRVKSDHIYQLYAYLTQSRRSGETHKPTGVLLYGQPYAGPGHLRTRIDGYPFFVQTLNLNQKWTSVEKDLMDTFKTVATGE